MRWLPFTLMFLLAYIEISLFIQVADVFGVAITLLLVIVTSCVGLSLVRNQGVQTLTQMQQKIAAGENPAAEMVKSVSLILAGILLLTPGFFTDGLGLLLLLPPIQRSLTLKLLRYVNIHQSKGAGNIFDGEFQRKNSDTLDVGHQHDQKNGQDKFKDGG